MGEIYLRGIRYGGMSGPSEADQVTVINTLPSGTKVADIIVNDLTTPIYVPASAGVEDVQIDETSIVDENNIANIPIFVGATTASDGAAGLVPAPATTETTMYLKADGTWDVGGTQQINSTDDADYRILLSATDTDNEDLSPIIHKNADLIFNPDKSALTIGSREETYTSQGETYNYEIGDNSVAIGYNNVAASTCSYAEGMNTLSFGQGAHTEGYGTIANGTYSHSEGYSTRANGNYSHAEGYNSMANTLGSHAEGTANQVNAANGHAEGGGNQVNEISGHAEGQTNTILSGATAGHAEGIGNFVGASHAHAEGYNTSSMGEGAHTEGTFNKALDAHAHAEGLYSTASGNESHTEGWRTQADGSQSHAEGSETYAGGDYSHAEGQGTVTNFNGQHAEGRYNIAENYYVHMVGNGTEETPSNAYTLDWDGNGIYAGKVTVGQGPVNDMDVATKQYVDTHGGGGMTYNGRSVPSSSLGTNGDTYYRQDINGNIIEEYIKLTNAWIIVPKSDAVLNTKTITQNGTYAAQTDDLDGFSSVTVNVDSGSSTLITKNITQNGTYTALDEQADGYSEVSVNIPSYSEPNFKRVYIYNNTDREGSSSIIYPNPYQTAISTSNFFLDLKGFYFDGTNTYDDRNTTFSSYSNNTLTYSWETQSGSTRQFFGIVAVENLNNIRVLSDWTQYNTNDVNEFQLPAEALGLNVDDFIIDFRNVCSGNSDEIVITNSFITKVIENNKLKITFPLPSSASHLSLEARILYVV